MFPEIEKQISKFFRKVENVDGAKDFIYQESNHAKWHIEFNKKVCPDYINDVKVWKFLLKLTSKFPDKFQASCYSAFEHITLIFSDSVLKWGVLDSVDGDVKDFWVWHAIEEREHREVCFQVLQHYSKSYLLRQAGLMWMGSVFLISWLEPFIKQLLREDLSLYKKSNQLEVSGNTMKCLKHWVRYLHPSFNPSGE